MQLVMQIQIYKNRTHKITYILPIRNWFKFARTKRIINNDEWAAETTSSGSEFQILSSRTAKKCRLQLTRECGENNSLVGCRPVSLCGNDEVGRSAGQRGSAADVGRVDDGQCQHLGDAVHATVDGSVALRVSTGGQRTCCHYSALVVRLVLVVHVLLRSTQRRRTMHAPLSICHRDDRTPAASAPD